jgi:DNA-binding MarR family transcriptional regulator
MMTEFWNNLTLSKRLYDQVLEPLTDEYHVTRMELDILLFLANNPPYDTAADIVERRRLTKSHISSSVKDLAERGYLERFYQEGDRKRVHLRVMPPAEPIVEAGRKAQGVFYSQLFRGFTDEEIRGAEELQRRMAENLRLAMKEKN